MRRHAPATARNREPLLAVLRDVLPRSGRILEIASGSGEHAVFFAAALPSLEWQPTDPEPESRASIDAWRADTGVANVCPALDLDARAAEWPVDAADAIVCINMIHIAPWESAVGLFRGAARILVPDAPLVLYGPFAEGGRHTAPSNATFDESLRARDPAWGVRDLDDVRAEASRHGFRFDRRIAMPANNLTIVFRRSGPESLSPRTDSPSRGS